MRSAKVSADDPSVALRAPAPFTQGSLRLTAPKASRRQSRQAASRIAGTPIEAGNRPGTPVLPPQRPFHRQSRQAASRVAGTSNRSRQPTGDSRPPVPRGKVQEGDSPSWFPAQAGKNLNHFSRRHVRREKFFSRSEMWTKDRLWAAFGPHPSAVLRHRLSALRALRRGLLAGENRLGDFSQRKASLRRAAPPSTA